VRRLLASLVAFAVVFSTTAVSSLHVHAYSDHDDASHHHGLASHEHQASSSERPSHGEDADHDDEAPHVEACERDLHVVPIVTMSCADAVPLSIDMVPASGRLLLTDPADRRVAVPFSDVRVHGPPGLNTLSLRGPPSLLPR
jgi:hypothetical protein